MVTISDNNNLRQDSKKPLIAERRAASPGGPAINGFGVFEAPLEVYTISCPESSPSVIENKYSLHDIASRLLCDPAFNTPDEQTMIDNKKLPRTSLCNKTPLLGGHTPAAVSVYRNVEHKGSAHFSGLLKCGSVWACNICAEKISAGRTEELQTAFSEWHDLAPGKNSHIMVTFTIPHKIYNDLRTLYDSLRDAKRVLKKQDVLKRTKLKVWSQIVEQYNIQGLCTGYEVTDGVNGWHPHTHDIFFMSEVLTHKSLLNLKKDLTFAWLYACQREGITIPNIDHFIERSIHISVSPNADEYISKFGKADFDLHKDEVLKSWGHAQELTKNHMKRSRGEKGMTPWDFLRTIQLFPENLSIYNQLGRKWREFVRVTKGRRQLFWSKGFKSFLKSQSQKFAELCEKSDQELAENKDSTRELLGVLSSAEWQIVLKNKLRGRVLFLSLHHPFSEVVKFINQHQKAVQNE